MSKKGQELPLSTIIIIILVVIALVVVVAFFLGGTTKMTDTIKRVFFGTTQGYDLNLALQICRDRCDQASNLPVEVRRDSAFCKGYQYVDKDGNGESDYYTDGSKKTTVKYYCPSLGNYPEGTLETDIGKVLGTACDLGTDEKGAEVRCKLPSGLLGSGAVTRSASEDEAKKTSLSIKNLPN